MSAGSSRLLRSLQEFFQTIKTVRAPLLLGALSLLVLSLPTQVLELYLILARDWPVLLPRISFTLLSLACLSLFIGYVSHILTRSEGDANESHGQRVAQSTLRRSMPLVLGLLPLVGCAIGLYRALQSASTEILLRTSQTIAAFEEAAKNEDRVREAFMAWQRHSGGDQELPVTLIPRIKSLLTNDVVPDTIRLLPEKTPQLKIAIYVGIAACTMIGVVLLVVSMRVWTSSPVMRGESKLLRSSTLYGVTAVFVTITALFSAQALDVGSGYILTSIPRAFGTLTLLNLSLLFLIFFCGLLTHWSDKNGIPLLSTLVAFALAFSFFNWNDNHSIRTIPEKKAHKREFSGVGDAFEAWFANRPAEHKKKFDGRPYPVYIVAAQGGGMYAANLAGLTLARIYDRCPAIRHHLFAVSGVSGGSIGAGYVAALLNDPTTTPHDDTCVLGEVGSKGPIETKMEALLQTDLLSPVAASFLFPDLLQRLIPYPVAAFDRARAFEAGVESAWDTAVKSQINPLRMPFLAHWRADGAAPMLFLNTTVVETGHQVAIAPVEIKSEILTLQTVQKEFARPGFDVPLSTAMSLSARFPLVMPAGRLALSHRDVRVADGGYFENSGTEAAISIVEQLQAHLCGPGADYSRCRSLKEKGQAYAFKLLVLTDYDPLADGLRNPNAAVSGLNEILSPVQTMFNSRVARGELIVGRLKHFVPRPIDPKEPSQPDVQPTLRTVLLSLNPQLYHLPLGWQLSAQVQSVISAQIGDPAACRKGANAPGYERAYQFASDIDAGLRLLGGEEVHIADRTPFVKMLSTLRGNQCAMFDVFGADGVGPRKPRCFDLHKVEARGSTRRKAVERVNMKWGADVEQQHGKAFADLDYADGVATLCTPEPQGGFSCWVEAAPCEKMGS